MISKYRAFPRNIDGIGDRAKKQFFRQKSILISVISKYGHFPRNIDSLGDIAKKRFFRQKSIFTK